MSIESLRSQIRTTSSQIDNCQSSINLLEQEKFDLEQRLKELEVKYQNYVDKVRGSNSGINNILNLPNYSNFINKFKENMNETWNGPLESSYQNSLTETVEKYKSEIRRIATEIQDLNYRKNILNKNLYRLHDLLSIALSNSDD